MFYSKILFLWLFSNRLGNSVCFITPAEMKWLIWIKCLVAAPTLLPFQVSDRIEESDRIKLLAHYSINQSINHANIIYFTDHKCMPKNLQDYLGNKVTFLK